MNVYAVYQDGRLLHRGLSREHAEQHAAKLAHGYESHRAGTKRRVAEFDVGLDTGLLKELDQNYQQLKKES